MKSRAGAWPLKWAAPITHKRVIEVLIWLIAQYGCHQYLRSDNGPEFIAEALLKFFEDQSTQPSRITPGKPWQNGRHESFNGTFRRECLDAERFHRLTEARLVIEDWRQQYNHERPHSALGYQAPGTAYGGGARQKTTAGDFAHVAGKFIAYNWPSDDDQRAT